MTGSVDQRQWHMFRRREEELWCAVPVESAVPPFRFSGHWDYRDRHPEQRAIPGYQRGIADQSVLINGFYLFQLLGADS